MPWARDILHKFETIFKKWLLIGKRHHSMRAWLEWTLAHAMEDYSWSLAPASWSLLSLCFLFIMTSMHIIFLCLLTPPWYSPIPKTKARGPDNHELKPLSCLGKPSKMDQSNENCVDCTEQLLESKDIAHAIPDHVIPKPWKLFCMKNSKYLVTLITVILIF